MMDGQGVDTDVVEGVGVDGVRPDDGGGVDRAVDQEVCEILLLNRATPSSSRSSSDGKNL